MARSSVRAPRHRRSARPDRASAGEVYTRYFRHWRTGRIIHAPPGKVFRFKASGSSTAQLALGI